MVVDDAAERASKAPRTVHSGPAGRRAPNCPQCGTPMRFEGGTSTHDLWAERYECPTCGAESFRSFGRGSV